MVNFTQIISASIEWTTAVLFRPFRFKKWLILAFVALLAGQLSAGGCNSSYNSPFREQAKEKSKAASSLEADKSAAKKSSDFGPAVYAQLEKIRKNKKLLVTILALLILFGILFTWLYSRFAFIFISDVVRNDASIKLPFKKYKRLGNSLFGFHLIFGLFSLLIFLGIVFMLILRLKDLGVFVKNASLQPLTLILASLPYAVGFILILLVFAMVYLIVRDFVQVVMFKDNLGFTAAWQKTLRILNRQKGEFFLYIVVKTGVAICALIISGLIYVVIMLALILQAILIGIIAAIIYRILPQGLHTSYLILLFAVGTPILVFLIYCLMCVYLPFAVFLRTFSLKFIALIAPEYNLFLGKHTMEA